MVQYHCSTDCQLSTQSRQERVERSKPRGEGEVKDHCEHSPGDKLAKLQRPKVASA